MEKHSCWEQSAPVREKLIYFLKWLALSVIVGLVAGGIGGCFARALGWVTAFRGKNDYLIYFLPLAGLVIVFLYQKLLKHDGGTNQVLATVHAKDTIPGIAAPMIFFSTLMTHLFGGSAGREGAALQLGGSLGNTLAKLFRLDRNDTGIAVMCGMSAAFAAVFGTPMAAAIFAMEVASIGILHASALFPCVISALLGAELSGLLGQKPEHFTVLEIPGFELRSAALTVLVAALTALVSMLFCFVLHRAGTLSRAWLENPYLRVLLGAEIVVLAAWILGNQDYCGASVGLIERALEGRTEWYSFLLKLLLTAATMGFGFKGGEIVPAFCVGATFGCLVGQVLGFSPSLCAACGMIALFCGATNCPLASLLIAIEMFGFAGMPYYLLTVAVSYGMSGYTGLYHEQIIVYSKYKTRFINRKTAD